MNTLTISPIINYFIMPGIAVGPYLLYQKSSQGKDSNTMYGIGPKMLLTLGQSANKGQPIPFVAAYAGWGKMISEYESYWDDDWDDWDDDWDDWDDDSWWTYGTDAVSESNGSTEKSESTVIRYGISAGILYMLSESVSLNLEASYQLDMVKPEGADEFTKGNNLIFGVGISGFVF